MASVASQHMLLELMDAGERGIVVDVGGQSEMIVRLEEMGLHAGAQICMVRPGSPCIVEINQQKFSMRFDDSVAVIVDVSQ